MKQVANRIKPGASLAEAADALDDDPRYQVVGQAEFANWMQELSDRALAELRGVHFDIPDEVMRLECKIAPPGGSIGAYYTSPSEDFSRPGRMWWSVPADRQEFSTWRETTTVYHEGAPGHHLQCAIALHAAAKLNTFQRLLCWVSGHGEGWALYAERLMHELGYLEDDGDLLGMLDGQLFRAARVVVDLGMHLELPIPAGYGFHEGERWTPELGLEFMLDRTITDPHHVRDEIDRYLGWPGGPAPATPSTSRPSTTQRWRWAPWVWPPSANALPPCRYPQRRRWVPTAGTYSGSARPSTANLRGSPAKR